jgi:predicted secreted protein
VFNNITGYESKKERDKIIEINNKPFSSRSWALTSKEVKQILRNNKYSKKEYYIKPLVGNTFHVVVYVLEKGI